VQVTRVQAISLLLAASLCLLPFLIPYHQQPILSFYPEWLAGALGTVAALAALTVRPVSATSLPSAARWLVVLALFLAVQYLNQSHVYPQLSLLAAIYVLYAALLIWLGAQLVLHHGTERVAIVLAGFLLAGALANSFAGVVQYYGRPRLLEDFIAEARGHGAYGNIAQWNLYANYLALGEGALLFLWLRARIRTEYAALALLVIVWASALSGSRGAILYSLWYAGAGFIAARIRDCPETHRLKLAAYTIAAATVAAHLLIPWLNSAIQFATPGEGTFDRMRSYFGEPARLEAARLALHVWRTAPLSGVGIGGFAGAGFELGLYPKMTRSNEIWTSPHNLLLQLLAETGAVGALLVIGGLWAWGCQAARSYRENPQPALWWFLAATGVELIHSLTEFPLWNAHFLGVTAILIGTSSRIQNVSNAISRATRLVAAVACVGLSLSLASLLRDYVRLDSTRITGAAVTLTSPAQSQQDAAMLRALRHGLLAPAAELWTLLGAPLNHDNLSDKLEVGRRVARYWPADAVVARYAVLLAFDGQAAQAREVLKRSLRAYPQRRETTVAILEQARPTDAAAIEPLLAMAKYAPKNPDHEP
jgi:hypothetical protein